MGEGGVEHRAFAHRTHLVALVVRYFHAGLSVLLLAVGLGLFFAAEGAARREIWAELATLLGANGFVSVIGLPVLVALTARWRRAPEIAVRRFDLHTTTGEIVVPLGEGELRRIPRYRVVSTFVENVPGDLRRIVLTMQGGPLRDCYVLVAPTAEAEAILAFVGPRPQLFDGGVRSVAAAGWTFSLACGAACVAAIVGSSLLRPHVPREVFEPFSMTESLGWILGFGVAAFGLVHALLALATRVPSVRLGVDGFSVVRGKGQRFWSRASLRSVTREGSSLEIVRADGGRDRVRLWPMAPGRIERLARNLRDAVEQVDSQAAAAPNEDSEAAPPSAAYRARHLDDEELGARLAAPDVTPDRRLRLASRLASRGPTGRAAVRVVSAEIADPDLRTAIDAIAEAEACAESADANEASLSHPRLRRV